MRTKVKEVKIFFWLKLDRSGPFLTNEEKFYSWRRWAREKILPNKNERRNEWKKIAFHFCQLQEGYRTWKIIWMNFPFAENSCLSIPSMYFDDKILPSSFMFLDFINFLFNFGTKYPWGFWLEEKKFNFLLKNLKLFKLVTGKRQVRKCNSIVRSRISRTSNILLRAHLSNHIGLLSLHGGFNLHQSAHKRQVYFIISNNKRKKKVENLLVKKDLGEPGVYHWRGSLNEILVQIFYDSLDDRIDLRCKRKKLKYHNCSSQIQTEIRLCKIYLILRWAQSPWSSKIQPVLQKITVWNELKGNRNFLAMWVLVLFESCEIPHLEAQLIYRRKLWHALIHVAQNFSTRTHCMWIIKSCGTHLSTLHIIFRHVYITCE